MPSFWVKLGSLTFQNVHSRLKYVAWPLSLTFSMFSTNCWGSQDIVMEPTWLVNWNRVLASSLKGIEFGCNINFVRPVSYLSTLPLSSWGLLHNWVVVNSKLELTPQRPKTLIGEDKTDLVKLCPLYTRVDNSHIWNCPGQWDNFN